MAYIDGDFLDDAFGSGNVTALCATSSEKALVIALAEAETYSALYNAGYQSSSSPDDFAADGSDCPDTVRLAAFGAWLELAHLRNRKELPPNAGVYTAKLAQIRDGSLEVPELTKDTERAVGGVVKTDTTSTVAAGGRPPLFDRGSMEGYG